MPKHSLDIFDEIQTLEGLLLRPEDKRWLEKPLSQSRSAATVLYLGCNILRTPHLAQTIIAIFQHIREDFVALGGPYFCCGAPYERIEGIEGARECGVRLFSYFQQFKPRQVVFWCPGCLNFCKNVLAISESFRLIHVSEFLAENREKLTFTHVLPTKVALHYHCGSLDSDLQAVAARALLAAVPGVELMDIGSNNAWGRNCTGELRKRMGLEAWKASIEPFFHKAVALNAEVFATLYHGCLRAYARYEKDFPLTIEHYLTTVGRSLGIAFQDKYKQYLLWKDKSRILEDSYSCLKANRLPLELASSVVERVFIREEGL